jgi:hypothetical protein
LSYERRYDADPRIGPGRANHPVKTISNELRSACPPRALTLPLICRISARPIGSSLIEITPIPVFLKEPETSVFGTFATCRQTLRMSVSAGMAEVGFRGCQDCF